MSVQNRFYLILYSIFKQKFNFTKFYQHAEYQRNKNIRKGAQFKEQEFE